MLSLTSEYALRAMIDLAQHEGDWPIPGRDIARRTGIPAKYLSKVLGDLVRAGLLTSIRGKSGGFRMTRGPQSISLYEVLVTFELGRPRRCPFGNVRCSDDDPCMAHKEWQTVLSARDRFLKRTSIRLVARRQRDRAERAGRARRRGAEQSGG